MPVRPALALLAGALLLTSCAAGDPSSSRRSAAPTVGDAAARVDPPAARSADPGSSDAADRSDVEGRPVELALTIHVGTMPDGSEVDIVVRSVEADGRREVTMSSPDGIVDHHVIEGDRHWWWIPPVARELTGGVEWVHLDVAEVEAVGELPDLVAGARVPLPEPGDVEVGVVVAGYEVVEVDDVGPDEQRLVLEGLDEPAVLSRRHLPASTRVRLPAGATDLRDLPEAAGR